MSTQRPSIEDQTPWRRIHIQAMFPSTLAPKIDARGRDTYDLKLRALSFEEMGKIAELIKREGIR
jgi:hypothetical protein